MKAIYNLGLLFTLFLVLLMVAGSSCLLQPAISPPVVPPPEQELPNRDMTPPQTVITVAPSENITSGEVTFEWIGSDDKTPTNKLNYSYYLEGHDAGYSPFTTDTKKTYTNLKDGTYTFYVKSHDEADNVDLTPAYVKFTVAIPKPEKRPKLYSLLSARC